MDVKNQLGDWMRARGITAMVVRPDSMVYAAAAAGEQLATPPSSTLPAGRYGAIAVAARK